MLSGTKLAGSDPIRGRADNDYYATNPEAVRLLLEKHSLPNGKILEPCVGGGNIVNALEMYHKGNNEYTLLDIVDRGYPNTVVQDFLKYEPEEKFDLIITNPPFSQAQEFIEHSLPMLADNGQLAMFLKIQFLEGVRRRELFERYPVKYIYVFTKRMGTWYNGHEYDPVTGKRLATTICHAWFIWEKGSTTEPIVRWL